MIRKSFIRYGVAALALAMAIVPISTGIAAAGVLPPTPITCTAAGTVLFSNGTQNTTWTIVGKGSCENNESTYFLDFTGTGTSDTLGICDIQEGVPEPIVTNLDIHVLGTLTDPTTLIPQAINQHWVAPLTTYPVVTPFLVQNTSGGISGAGAFFNHIFLMCQNNPVAQFTWVFVR